jgi:hypothetical protein
MIAIFSNNYSTDHYIRQLKFQQQYQVYHSVDQYVAATADVKIAFVNHINSYELPESEQQRLDWIIDGYKFSQEIDRTQLVSNLVVAFDCELHPYHLKLIRRHGRDNMYWVLPGQINHNRIVDQKNIIVWNAHFSMTAYPYKTLTNKIQQICHNTVKPLLFDALLGQRKPHRDFIYNAVESDLLKQKFLITYINNLNSSFKTSLIWEPDIEEFPDNADHSTARVKYQGQDFQLCGILPIQIYNQTAYSIVAETGISNRYSFFTEKTAKPIMARRLFVMFSGQNFLHNLRSLGFRTFDNVIDESYDIIQNDQERWSAAFEQVQRLCNMDQTWVFEQIADTVEHNYQLLMNTDWNQHMLAQLQQKLNQLNT